MTIQEVPGVVKFEDLQKLIQVLPDSIHLTIIGGQALSFWVMFYQDVFPEQFEDSQLRVGTMDIDFLTDKESMEICADAWGVALQLPPSSHEVVAQIGLLELELDGREVVIDFLTDFVYPRKVKQRYLDLEALSSERDIKILGPKATLLSKIGNVLILRRQSESDLGQLRTAMRVVRCCILEDIEQGSSDKASQTAQFVLFLANDRHIGRPLRTLSIDLIDIFPDSFDGFDPRFIKKTLEPALERLRRDKDV